MAILSAQMLNDSPTRAALVAARAAGWMPTDGVTYTAGGVSYLGQTGATAIPDLLGLVPNPAFAVTPEHFGAPTSGDCTAAIEAMSTYANTLSRKHIRFLPRIYNISGSNGFVVRGVDWQIDFDGGSELRRSTAGPFVVIDFRTGHAGRIAISNPRGVLTGVAAGSRGNSHVINFLGDPAQAFGASYVTIHNPAGAGTRTVVNFTETGALAWEGIPQLMRYFSNTIINPFTDTAGGAATIPEFGIVWESGTGNHNQVIGGNLAVTEQAVKFGDGVMAVHDLTFIGTHFLGQKGGCLGVGPTDPLRYRLNINLVGVQFDGASSGYTFRFENMQDFRVVGINSQNGVNYQLVNCTGPYTIEDNNGNVISTVTASYGALNVASLPVAPASVSLTPSVTFATPGDLAVTYTTRSAEYVRFGNFLFVRVALNFNLTYTTASSVFLVTLAGLPGNLDADSADRGGAAIGEMANFTWNALDRQAFVRVNSANSFRVEFARNVGTMVSADTTNVTAGNFRALTFSGWVKLA